MTLLIDNVRHGRVAREIELMVECGVAPKDALIAATSSAAKLSPESAANDTILPIRLTQVA